MMKPCVLTALTLAAGISSAHPAPSREAPGAARAARAAAPDRRPAGLPPLDPSYLLLPFDVSLPGAFGTSAFDIDDRGTVVGNFALGDQLHGFVFQDAQFIDVTVANATFVELVGIANDGTSVGDFGDASGVFHGIVRAADGSITTLPDPPAARNFPKDINVRGVIVGNYFAPGCTAYVFRNGRYRPLTVDLAAGACPILKSINDRGQIVGFFFDPNVGQRSFLLSPRRDCDDRDDCDEYAGAHAEDISVPGIPTIMWSINNHEEIVGAYRVQGADFDHGVIRRHHKLRTIDFPGTQADTTLLGISDGGIIVGTHGGFNFGLMAVPLDR